MKKIKICVVGAGLISQIEHIPNLLRLNKLFELVGVADPSKNARNYFSDRGIKTFSDYGELFSQQLDAVLIASPDSYHAEIAHAALDRGLHVFSEKPLCYSMTEADNLIKARDKSKKVVQVGYMKRFDPNYELLRKLLPKNGLGLRLISVEVQDPGAWPFNQHQGELILANDIPADLILESRKLRYQQVVLANGKNINADILRGFTGPYASSLVHDINAVHGLLETMNLKTSEVTGAAFFADGTCANGSVRIKDCDALWQMSFVSIPKLAEYRERISLYFDDSVYHLEFPSPYLNHFPTKLSVSISNNETLQNTEYCSGYEEAFIRELQGFWASVTLGEPIRNTIEDAKLDMQLIANLTANIK
jgi:predicted dehydrogenase